MRDTLTKSGKLALRLLEDLTALAAGGSVCANMSGSSSCLKDVQILWAAYFLEVLHYQCGFCYLL